MTQEIVVQLAERMRKRRPPIIGPVVKRARRAGRFRGRRANRRTEGELKFHDVDIDDSVIAQGANIAQVSCNLIAQGVTESQRIGRKCTIKKIAWRFTIVLPTTAVAASGNDTARVILYQDRQTNGATATTATILQSNDYQAFRNLLDVSRYIILMDRTYAPNSTAGSGRGSTDTLSYAGIRIEDSFYKNCNIPLEFSGINGVIAEIRTNNIGVLLLSAQGDAGFFSKMRLRFSDG